MNFRFRSFALLLTPLIWGLFFGENQEIQARGTGWSPVIIATGAYREQIKSMPIEQRPNRPLHFYGNSVRRNHRRASGNTGNTQRFRSNGSKSVAVSSPTRSLPRGQSRDKTFSNAKDSGRLGNRSTAR